MYLEMIRGNPAATIDTGVHEEPEVPWFHTMESSAMRAVAFFVRIVLVVVVFIVVVIVRSIWPRSSRRT